MCSTNNWKATLGLTCFALCSHFVVLDKCLQNTLVSDLPQITVQGRAIWHLSSTWPISKTVKFCKRQSAASPLFGGQWPTATFHPPFPSPSANLGSSGPPGISNGNAATQPMPAGWHMAYGLGLWQMDWKAGTGTSWERWHDIEVGRKVWGGKVRGRKGIKVEQNMHHILIKQTSPSLPPKKSGWHI